MYVNDDVMMSVCLSLSCCVVDDVCRIFVGCVFWFSIMGKPIQRVHSSGEHREGRIRTTSRTP